MPTMKQLAEKRGTRAAKLFTKISDAKFDQLLGAIYDEERHRTDPATFPNGGRDIFYQLCMEAVESGKSNPSDPTYGLKDWEIAAFIDDLWNATMGSRRLQESKPCW